MQLLWMVFLAGLAGGFGHCMGMCGGVVAACSFAGCAGKPKIKAASRFQVLYHSGRLITYSLIGAVFGALGTLPALIEATRPYQYWVPVIAGTLMIGVGISMALGWGGKAVTLVGNSNNSNWFTRAATVLSGRGTIAAFPLGLLMGFIPCGLLAVIELRALASGSAATGAAVMLSFGLGTVPGLGGFGFVSGLLGAQTRGILLKAGAVIITVIGIMTIIRFIPFLKTGM